MSVMDQPINGSQHHHVLRKDAVSAAKRLVGGDQQATCLVSMRHEFEPHRRLVFTAFDGGGVIDDQ